MNDLFALDLTINLLLLGVGAAMVAGNLTALFKNNSEDQKLYFSRTVFLTVIGTIITIWSIASIINR